MARGQVRKRGHGRYQVQIYLGRVDGRDRYHTKTLKGSKRAAERYCREFIADKEAGRLVESTGKRFQQFLLDDWLPVAKKHRVSKKTYHNYEFHVRRWCGGELGDTLLSEVTPLQIQELYSFLAMNYSAATCRWVHECIGQGLRQARRWRLIEHNPMEDVEKPRTPRRKKKQLRAMDADQARNFLLACQGDPLQALWELLLATGMRPGEALGLQWSEVDWSSRTIRIVQAVVHPPGGGWELDACKTDGSRRSVVIPAAVLDSLRQHRVRQLEHRMLSTRWEDHDLVFPSTVGTPLRLRNAVKRSFRPIMERAGLEGFSPYCLRHTCATLLLLQKVPPKVVSERLGHSSIHLTMNTYSSVLPTMQQQASDALEAMGIF